MRLNSLVCAALTLSFTDRGVAAPASGWHAFRWMESGCQFRQETRAHSVI